MNLQETAKNEAEILAREIQKLLPDASLSDLRVVYFYLLGGIR